MLSAYRILCNILPECMSLWILTVCVIFLVKNMIITILSARIKSYRIPGGRLDSITTKNQVEEASAVFSDMMGPMIGMLCGVSAIIFVVVMYLMLKVMIDRSSFPIALMQMALVYRTKEIRKLYLNGNFYIVAIGGIFCTTFAKVAMDRIYPFLVVSCIRTRRNQSDIWMEIICRRLCSHHPVVFCDQSCAGG